jgi:uncharacterized protein YjbJ (UPF0337 family)
MLYPLAYMLSAGHSPHNGPGQAGRFDRGEAVPPGAAALAETRHSAASTRGTDRTRGCLEEEREMAIMVGEIDQIKQRIKKAAGVLADDDSLTSEGKVDQAVGKMKEKVIQVKGKLQQAVDQMRAAVAAKKASRWTK